MTPIQLPLVLAIGSLGAAVSAWGLAHGGRAARWGAIAGGVALLLLLALTLTMSTQHPGRSPGTARPPSPTAGCSTGGSCPRPTCA